MNPPPTALQAALPTSDQRHAAVLAALASAPRLLRFAARITRDLDDAEDAYQRSMEIALRSAPVVEADRFMAWLRTVLRNEAISVAQRRRREGPGLCEDAAVTADRSGGTREPTGLEAWRHRYQAVTEAFDHLTDPQRVCIILQARGASYADICQATGFTRRKVERSILEGRAALRRWEGMVETGEACARVRGDFDDVVAGTADGRQRRRVQHHTRHCLHCHGVLRTRRIHRDALSALAPACLLPTAAEMTPDPSLAAAWFDRVMLATSVRAGGALQTLVDAPGPMVVKAGAALTAAAVAAGVGGPLLSGAGERPAPASPTAALAAPTAPAASTHP
ncbi:MAG: sigma-70 family RNA polymerase sigma factor, partial [Thermoleophilia bacterium]|nr:sigma-70 family RNA polymerase sigma factor [Thermoleophilia bacterium]